jgi:hypothetical protein
MFINAKDYATLQKAVDAAITQNKPLYAPAGTYVIDSVSTVKINIPAGKSFTLYGDGDKTVFKRKNNTATNDGQNLFYVRPAGGDVPQVTMYSFAIDGNARNNPLPAGANPYLWEHSASIKFKGENSARIQNVIIHDVSAFDPLADHVFFSGAANSYVEHGHIYNFNGYDRNRVRSDITVTGGMKSLLVENSITTRLEAELNEPYDEGVMEFTVKNVQVTKRLDIGGKNKSDGTVTLNLTGENITANDINFHMIKGSIKNSTFNLSNSVVTRINNLKPFVFENIDFNVKPNSQGVLAPVAFQPYAGNDVTITDCRFNLVGANTADGYMLWFKPASSSLGVKYKVINTVFDPRLKRNIDADRSGTVTLINDTYSGSEHAIRVNSESSRPLTLTITGGDKSKVTGQFVYVQSKTGLKLIIN